MLFAGLLALLASACGERAADEATYPAEPVRIFAAASLTDVLQDVADAYAATGQPAPVLNFAASSDLARQIEQGADADIFISADEAWVDYLDERDLINATTRKTVLGNALVLIAPAGSSLTLEMTQGADFAAALDGGTLAIADPESVPAGRYAKEALTWMGAWDGVADMTARTESVRAALRFVETGEAAAGIAYATDAKAAAGKVIVVGAFPAESHTPVSYPAALTADADAHAGAALDFLMSEESKRIFAEAGFIIAE
jgi:molybdate transport system substrate-binding protein